jgi:hypothetical protein
MHAPFPQVLFWDVAQQQGRLSAHGTWTPPGVDGLYAPLLPSPPSPVNALAVAALGGGSHAAGPPSRQVHMVTAHEGGLLRLYTVDTQ